MPQIPRLRPAALALASFLAVAPVALAGGFVAPDELEAGDRCVGKTVFAGSEIDSFDLTILGVVHGASPGGNVIIARAEDERLEKTG